MRIKTLLLVLYALAVAIAAPSLAEDEGWKIEWGNGHKMESSDNAFKLKFGGRIQADFHFADGDSAFGDALQNGFEFRRARLFFSGTIYERVEFKAQYDFAGGDADFKDVWIALKGSKANVKLGHYKEFFSLEELTSAKYLAFAERSLPVEAFAPSRNSGVGVYGNNGDKLNWGIGVFYDADDFGVSTGEDNINITGRVAFRPVYEDKGRRMLHIAVAASQKDLSSDGTFRFRARPEQHLTDRFVDTGDFAADSALLLGVEVAGVADRFWFAAEYLSMDVDAPTVGDPNLTGGYVQAGYFLTEGDYRRFKTSGGEFDRQKPSSPWLKEGGTGAWEIAARYSTLDLNDGEIAGGEEDNLTIGLNWYPNPATRMMLNYVLADVEGIGDANLIIMRWQVDF